jgi:hypothetical protein
MKSQTTLLVTILVLQIAVYGALVDHNNFTIAALIIALLGMLLWLAQNRRTFKSNFSLADAIAQQATLLEGGKVQINKAQMHDAQKATRATLQNFSDGDKQAWLNLGR